MSDLINKYWVIHWTTSSNTPSQLIVRRKDDLSSLMSELATLEDLFNGIINKIEFFEDCVIVDE